MLPSLQYRRKKGDKGFEVVDLEDFQRRAPSFSVSPESPARIDFHQLLFPDYDGIHEVDFKSFAFDRGSVVYVGPGEVNRWTFNGRAKGFMLLMTDEFFGLARPRLPAGCQFFWRKARCWRTPNKGLAAILAAALREEELLDLPIDSSAALAAHLIEATGPDLSGRCSVRDVERFMQAKALLDCGMTHEKSVSFYASAIGMTPDGFSLLVKRLIGMSAKEWIDEAVALEAKRRLAVDSAPIGLLSQELGFRQETHFVRFFKRVVGTTPGKFRKSGAAG